VCRNPLTVEVMTLASLIVFSYTHQILSSFSACRELHAACPFYYAETLDKIVGIATCLLAVCVTLSYCIK
jgi:hypothetical protein